jgi:glycosyltransferase involved in cell wall biosynthesis
MTQVKLKVLQVGKYYPPVRGGIETHLAMLCRGLRDVVELEVVVANQARDEITDVVEGVHVRRLGTLAKIAGAPFCAQLPGIMRRTDADIIHIHTPHPTALVSYLVSGCRARLVCSYHSDIVRQRVLGALIKPIQDLAFRRAAVIPAASPDIIAGSPILAGHRARCELIPYGLEPTAYEHPDTQAITAIRQRFGCPLLLSVGRLVYYKGFEVLVRALRKLPVPANLLIIGEGPLQAVLEAEIAAAGLTGRVHLLGNVSDTVPYYQACDLFVLPSVARSEAFGIVQLEAMVCGKPVVNTRLAASGVPFVSRDGESGLTVTPSDSDALAAALARLLGDDALRLRFGLAGRKRVEEEFTAQKMVARTLAVYHRVVDAPA